MAKGILLSDQQAAEVIAGAAGIEIDSKGQIKQGDPGRASGRMRDVGFEQKMASMKQRLRATGIQPATVINFLPVKLTVNSPMTSFREGVPPARGTARFSFRTWNDVEIVPHHDGDAGRVPYEFHPLQIAEAFEHEYPHGGAVAIFGGVKEADSAANKKRVDDAERDAIKWMQGQVARGEALWNAADRMQRQLVTNVHRACAERLVEIKVLKALPSWVHEKVELHEVPAACGRCGKTPENRNMLVCTCGWVLDPEQAFIRKIINEEDESLERLTRAQVEKLGISAYVAETADEMPARLKAGLPKPPSAAYMRAAQAAEEAEARQTKSK